LEELAHATKDMAQLRHKNTATPEGPPPRVDPQLLIDAQSVPAAILAALAALLILSFFWMVFADVSGRVFPWFSIIQGIFIGLAVRRFGRGLDWRFPLIAGLVAWCGAFFGNLLVAVPVTTGELDVGTFDVIRGLTWWSITTFFAEVITVVDHIYAFCAAAVGIFYSKRRLNRHEEFALRTRS
jgi:hypothetical protein